LQWDYKFLMALEQAKRQVRIQPPLGPDKRQACVHQLNTLLNWSIDPAGKSAACVMERSPRLD
jgi:hypothetical protein